MPAVDRAGCGWFIPRKYRLLDGICLDIVANEVGFSDRTDGLAA